jgi:UDP-N-acetylmuramoylalanine--D-glutamate ligase
MDKAIRISIPALAADQTVVVGLGATGVSVARYLRARNQPFAVADTRLHPPGIEELVDLDSAIPVFLGTFDSKLFLRAKRLVVSPGLSLNEPAIQQAKASGVEVIGDVELFARHASAPVVAITGSNGKSTVTTWLTEMARRAGVQVKSGGNLGIPALTLLMPAEPELYVLELSSFQLETLSSLQPVAAAVLNVSPDHMDRYRDENEYAAVKAKIYRHARVQIINRDDSTVLRMQLPGRSISFGLDVPEDGHYGLLLNKGTVWLARGKERLIEESRLRLSGRHNTANALAAMALAEAAGLPRVAVIEALQAYQGLPHRSQWTIRYQGVDWFNDSKGTNVGATLAALNGMPGKVVLIAGGMAKEADFSPLREAVQRKARGVILMGQDARVIAQSIAGTVPVEFVDDMRSAVVRAAELAKPGDSVLLSPACASLDMYRDYRERGEVFMHTVKELMA